MGSGNGSKVVKKARITDTVRMTLSFYKPLAGVGKLGDLDATYTSISASCPSSCLLRDNGCYAQNDNVAMHIRPLDNVAKATGATGADAAVQEAACIDGSWGGGPVPGRILRLHVGGDCATVPAAATVAGAVGRWLDRGGKAAYTYTHAWSVVPRAAWGRVSVLASMDSGGGEALANEAAAARAQGYAPARVVGAFPNEHKVWREAGVTWIPCPNQTARGAQCADCKLCFDGAALLAKGLGIAFEAHGNGKGKVKRRLAVLQ